MLNESAASQSRSFSDHAKSVRSIADAMGQVVKGKPHVIERVICCMIARGHVLLEDVPGVGKTTLGLTLSRAVGGSFQRVQFTNDLLPSDIVGVNIFHPEGKSFHFHPGPLFANFVLADEINRTTPKTQSALLESMQEYAVTVDGQRHTLPHPFMVIATQNPVQFLGTFPLPESQLDRFLMKLDMGYPEEADELDVLQQQGRAFDQASTMNDIASAVDLNGLIALQESVPKVTIETSLQSYIVRIAKSTREHPRIQLGASTRGALALDRAARSWALMNGRDHVLPDDIQALAPDVLAHRLVLRDLGTSDGAVEQSQIALKEAVREIIEELEVPV